MIPAMIDVKYRILCRNDMCLVAFLPCCMPSILRLKYAMRETPGA